MTLQDKLYKSSEVCDILGVSLRTLYRYIEDRKMGSVQLSSGRHRFTKDQIEGFLQLGPDKQEKVVVPESIAEIPVAEIVSETSVSHELHEPNETYEPLIQEKPVETFSMMGLGEEEEVKEEVIEKVPSSKPLYFRCPFDDLRVIAKLVKRAGENASADYAFTGPAGLSLFYPIKAFDKLHFYVSPDQMDFWKLRLQLEDAGTDSANVVIIKADTVEVFDMAGERGGLKHVSVDRLKEDLRQMNMDDELKEFESKGY